MNKDRFELKQNNSYKYFIETIDKNTSLEIDNYIKLYKTYRMLDNKREVEKEVYEKFNIKLKDIIAYGDTSDISLTILNKIIDTIEINDFRSVKPTTVKVYKCFTTRHKRSDDKQTGTIPGFVHNGVISHEDKHSSWNCLMGVLNHPKYCLIYKERVE